MTPTPNKRVQPGITTPIVYPTDWSAIIAWALMLSGVGLFWFTLGQYVIS